jgi:hypothetical protein
VRSDDLAPFAVADGLLARVQQRPSGMTGQERMELLSRAREALATATDVTAEDAGKLLTDCALEGELTIQCGDQFAVVSAWGRLLTVMARVELRGVCHPDAN